MSLTKHLRDVPSVAMTSRGYERLKIAEEARIEAVLYRADVPEQYHRELVPQLRDASLRTLNSTIPLYEILRKYNDLSEETKARLVPQLATIELARLVRQDDVRSINQYMRGIVQDYLAQIKSAVVKHSRFKDRHLGTGKLIYGNSTAEIPYKSVIEKVSEGKSSFRRQSPAQIKKIDELVEQINLGNWQYALEVHRDLLQFATHLFSRVTTYRQFLFDIESIMLQKSDTHKVVITRHHEYGFPTGYRIMKPEEYNLAIAQINGTQAPLKKISHGRPEPRSNGIHLSSERKPLERRVEHIGTRHVEF